MHWHAFTDTHVPGANAPTLPDAPLGRPPYGPRIPPGRRSEHGQPQAPILLQRRISSYAAPARSFKIQRLWVLKSNQKVGNPRNAPLNIVLH